MRKQFSVLKNTLNTSVTVSFITLLLCIQQFANAQDEDQQQWWFNVEVIAFKRDLLSSNAENFENANVAFSNIEGIDLLTLQAHKLNEPLKAYSAAIGTCMPNNSNQGQQQNHNIDDFLNKLEPATTQTKTESFITPATSIIEDAYHSLALQDYQLLCLPRKGQNLTKQIAPSLDAMPTYIFANTDYFVEQPHLLNTDSLTLIDYAKRVFSQRDLQPLLHTAWRQDVAFGINNAEYLKIRAGKLLGIEPDAVLPSAYLLEDNKDLQADDASQVDIFDDIADAIEAKTPTNWLSLSTNNNSEDKNEQTQHPEWELDGLFKVYLEYVNLVPYLHIESEFKHHKLSMDESGKAIINAYPFKQRRRVVSKQIHYFDHPAFGIIVRLERFTPPVKTVSLTELLGQ